MRFVLIVALLATCTSLSFATDPQPAIRVLIVDGQNNHRWAETTPYMKEILEKSGRFTVEVATAPPSPNTAQGKEKYAPSPDQYAKDLMAFRPEFDRFDAILLNYNGDGWSDETHSALEAAIAKGTGLIVVHAANNAFFSRKEYAKMLGLSWRPTDFGVRLKIDETGAIERVPAGSGPNVGHGERRPFQVVVRDADHPITHGMPTKWMHVKDELYHGLRGPAEAMTVLAIAYSDPARGGTGSHEPIAWTVDYKQGRVFHLVLGHDVSAMQCVGFITLLSRGCEWAATGQVSLPIPEDFPTEKSVRTRGGWWLSPDRVKRYWPWLLALPVVGFVVWRWRRTPRNPVVSQP